MILNFPEGLEFYLEFLNPYAVQEKGVVRVGNNRKEEMMSRSTLNLFILLP